MAGPRELDPADRLRAEQLAATAPPLTDDVADRIALIVDEPKPASEAGAA